MTALAIPQPSREGKTPVAWDTETHLIAPGLLAPPMVCLSFAEEGGESGIIHAKDPACKAFLVQLLGRSDYISVGANIPYDVGVVMAAWPDLTPLLFEALEGDRMEDVQTRQRLIDIARGQLNGYRGMDGKWREMRYNLAALEERHLKRDRSAEKGPDAWRLRYAELADVPVENWPVEAYQYPIDDAEGTLQVYQAQREYDQYLLDSFRQTRAHVGLHLMSCRGVTTEARAIAAHLARTEERIAEARGVAMAAGLVVERKSPTKSQRDKGVPGPWFAKKMKLAQERMTAVYPDCPRTKPTKRHPEGTPQITETNAKASGDEALIAYQAFSSAGTVVNAIYDLRKGSEGYPIQSRFTPILDTGRTSSTGPNIQNRSRAPGDRECFVPRPGWVFANADYDGVELRTLAQACLILLGRSMLADALNAGRDPHLQLGAAMLGVDYETAAARMDGGDLEIKGARQNAKAGNFGFPGGMGVKTFIAAQLAQSGRLYTEAEATQLRTDWLNTWDEMGEYFAMISRATENGGAYLRQLGSERVRGDMTYSQACNTYFQGLAADAAKAALWALTRACYVRGVEDALYGCRLVNFVHDEFIMEVPDDRWAHERATRMAEIMCEATRSWVPDVPLTAGPLLMRRWSKSAADRYDSEGRLVPWDCDPEAPIYKDGKHVGFAEVFRAGAPTFKRTRAGLVQVSP